MKNLCLFILLFSSFSTFAQQQLQLEWAKSYVNNSISNDIVADMEMDSKGFIYLGGRTYNEPFFNVSQIQIIKYSPNGDLLWAKTHGGVDSTIGKHLTDIKLYDNELFVLGIVYGHPNTNHLLLAKYDTDGNLIWSIEQDAFQPNVWMNIDFHVAESGNIYIVHDKGGSYPTQSIHLMKLNSNGQTIWEKDYSVNTTSLDYLSHFRIDKQENIYLGGRTSQYDVIQHGFFDANALVTKFDSSGTKIWENIYDVIPNSTYDNYFNNMTIDSNSNIYFEMEYQDSLQTNAHLLKIDSSGVLLLDNNLNLNSSYYKSLGFKLIGNHHLLIHSRMIYQNAVMDSLSFTKYDLTGNLIYEFKQAFSPVNIALTSNNNYNYVTKNTTTTQLYTEIIDSQGQLVQDFHFTDTTYNFIHPQKILVEDNGAFVIGGLAHKIPGNEAFYALKYSYTSPTKPIQNIPINVQFYPNPVTDISKILIDTKQQNIDIQVFNVLGQQMTSPDKISNQHFEVNKNDYEKGLYFYTILVDDKQVYSGSFQVF